MNRTDHITSGPIARTVISLAVPVTAGMFMEFALNGINYFWVGRLGPTAQDAVTTSMVVIWTIFSLISIISVGLTALVSRHVGARDFERAAYFVKQGLVLAVGLGAVLSVAGFFLAPVGLRFMDSGPDTKHLAIPYLQVFFASAVVFFLADTAYAAFRASGDTRTPTWIGILVVVLNMALDPLLIFGLGPMPELGVAGASVATGCSVLIGTVIVLRKIFKGSLGYRVKWSSGERPQIREMLRIARIGLPIAVQQFTFVVVYWFLIKIVHQFGETAAAAMGIGNRMESLSYFTCFGFSIAASTMVGQNLGAGQPDRAGQCAWGAVRMALALTFIISVFFVTIPSSIASIFTDNAAVLAIATDYLIILGLSQVTMATEIVLEGAFGGAGDTLPPMLVMIPGAVARIPLAYLLCFTLDWGINGVWWTLTITTTLKAITLAVWFKRGHWKARQV
ncbi:MAG TPA: MATE family efflux transporter [Candidatus Deferrimicrobium sp.]|nr:MATE family efflux transporter [Candidatus Deferrimicrobium sp.]